MKEWLCEMPSLDDQTVTWIDEISAGVGGSAFATARLLERHRRYYSQRVPGFMELTGDTAWWGECPFCEHLFAIDGKTGWWLCAGCGRQGEAYTLEFMLMGELDPTRWDACWHAAEALLSGRAPVAPTPDADDRLTAWELTG